MYSVIYINREVLELQEFTLVASTMGYTVQSYNDPSEINRLNIYGPEYSARENINYLSSRQCVYIVQKIMLQEFYDEWHEEENEAVKKQIKELDPKSIFWIQFHLPCLCELAVYLENLMKRVGGGIIGEEETIHTFKTIRSIKHILHDGTTYIDCALQSNTLEAQI